MLSKLWVHALFVGDSELDLLDPTVDRLGYAFLQDKFNFSAHKCLARNRGFRRLALVRILLHATTQSIFRQNYARFFSATDSYAVTMGETLRKFRSKPTLKEANEFKMSAKLILPCGHICRTINSVICPVNDAADIHPSAQVGAVEEDRWADTKMRLGH